MLRGRCCGGGLYGSLSWQLSSTEAQDICGLPNSTVVLIKVTLYAVSLVALFLSARLAIAQRRTR